MPWYNSARTVTWSHKGCHDYRVFVVTRLPRGRWSLVCEWVHKSGKITKNRTKSWEMFLTNMSNWIKSNYGSIFTPYFTSASIQTTTPKQMWLTQSPSHTKDICSDMWCKSITPSPSNQNFCHPTTYTWEAITSVFFSMYAVVKST